MSHEAARKPKRKGLFRTVEGAVVAAIVVILAGLVVPTVQTWRVRSHESRARDDLSRIRDAILRFVADNGMAPSRSRDGRDGALYRMIGSGLIPEGAYYFPDDRQGFLDHHLHLNRPQGAKGAPYPDWRGPYLDRVVADPWGFAYVVVLYPLVREDDRDCLVVSAGRNGILDGDYAAARDPIAAGDDLLEIVFDKSPDRRAPIR